MAISFVNAGAEGSAASGNITLGAPASPQNDDIWIAIVHSSDQVSHTFTDWTQIFQANGGGTTSRLSVWYFRYAGSTPNLVVSHSAGQSPIGGILAFRGCVKTGSPVDTTGSGSAGTDASIELTGITPTHDNCMLVACDGAADDNNRSTLPTGFAAGLEDTAASTQNCYQTTAGTPDGSVAGHYKLHTSGATGNFTDTQAAADPWASVLIALNPFLSSSLSGSISPSGDIAKKDFKPLSGAITSAGSIIKKAEILILAGTITSSGILTTAIKYGKSVSGVITSSGALVRKSLIPLTGAITSNGVLTKKSLLPFSGVISSSGTLVKKALKSLSGSIATSGNLTKITKKILSGILSSAGALSTVFIPGGGGTTYFQNVAGTLTSSGIITRRNLKSLSGIITLSGSSIKKAIVPINGILTSAGSVTKKSFKTLSGTLNSGGGLLRKIQKQLSGILTSSGILSTSRLFYKALSGVLSSNGILIKKTNKQLSGILVSTGIAIKHISRFLFGILISIGQLIPYSPTALQPGEIVLSEITLSEGYTILLSSWSLGVNEMLIRSVDVTEQSYDVQVSASELGLVTIEEQGI